MADPGTAHSRLSNAYPSPSIAPGSYNYTPNSQPSEQYREQLPATSAPMGMSLPPIRAIDAPAQAPLPPQTAQPVLSSPMPPHPPTGGYYQQPNGQGIPIMTGGGASSPPHQLQTMSGVRYQIAPQAAGDQRMMSGGRHKKEIKRRTKTGCLTCRKRRIKCDEGQPTCNNCRKSKRDCAGYDPIFKQQAGPAQIQPAPTSSTPGSSASNSAPHLPPTTYANVPQGYAPAATGGYQAPQATTTPAGAAAGQYQDHPAFIDPALGTDHGAMPYDGARDMRGPFSNDAQAGAERGFPVKQCNIEDLFAANDVAPLPIPADFPVRREDIEELWQNDYVTGLDALLETDWFSNHGYEQLLKQKQTFEAFGFLQSKFLEYARTQDRLLLDKLPSLEAKVVWLLLCLCRNISPAPAAPMTTPASNGAVNSPQQPTPDIAIREARSRLDILEHLLTGRVLEANPLLSLSYPTHDPSSATFQSREFWKHLGTFVSLRDDNGSASREIESSLAAMRGVLAMQEQRDVIYSIAVIRHVAPRLAPGALQQATASNAEEDAQKVHVAKQFLYTEANTGMTQTFARISSMAVRSWNLPGRAPTPVAANATGGAAPGSAAPQNQTQTQPQTQPQPQVQPQPQTQPEMKKQ